MATVTFEAIELLKQASEFELMSVVEFLKHQQNDMQNKKEALNQLIMMRKEKNITASNYKEEYHNYIKERYKI